MSMFYVAAIGCTGLGPVAAGWIEMNPHLGWRWIQWIHFMKVYLPHLLPGCLRAAVTFNGGSALDYGGGRA